MEHLGLTWTSRTLNLTLELLSRPLEPEVTGSTRARLEDAGPGARECSSSSCVWRRTKACVRPRNVSAEEQKIMDPQWHSRIATSCVVMATKQRLVQGQWEVGVHAARGGGGFVKKKWRFSKRSDTTFTPNLFFPSNEIIKMTLFLNQWLIPGRWSLGHPDAQPHRTGLQQALRLSPLTSWKVIILFWVRNKGSL